MRPVRFADSLLAWICADQQVRARSFADAGYTEAPYGVQVWLPTGAFVHLQTVGVAAPGDYYSSPETPVTGPVLPETHPVTLATTGQTHLTSVERWLAWRITAGRSAEISQLALFQDREGGGAVPHGVAVRCYSGAKLWVYFRHTTPPGQPPGSGPVWRPQAAV